MKIVIIGNGIAGVTCATELRRREPDPERLEIEVYGREAYLYYARIKLPEVIGYGFGTEEVRIHKEDWYEQRHIPIFLGEEAVRIDANAHVVYFSSGHITTYDKLVLATGADSFRPPIPGNLLKGTFVLREFNDAQRLFTHVKAAPGPAIIIGGGLLGLEAARQIREAGVEQVNVIEFFDRLLPRQLDKQGGTLLARMVEDMGILVHLSAETERIHGEHVVEGVTLKDGRRINARTVLFSVGIRPRLGLAQLSGLAVSKGIIVNEFLQSSDPDIYAIGDCAEFGGIVWGIIPAALEQAPVAAAHALGDSSKPYRQTVPKNTLKVAGLDVASFGKVNDEVAPGTRHARVSSDGKRYEAFMCTSEGTLEGAVLLGSKDHVKFVQQRLGTVLGKEDLTTLLAF